MCAGLCDLRIFCALLQILSARKGMMRVSIWKDCEIAERKPLDKNISCDTLVIGAGMAGILTAHMLERRGIKTVVIDSGRIASGQTSGTTAKITSQHAMIYAKLSERFGEEKACAYARFNQGAVGRFESMIKDLDIDCDFEHTDAYIYSTRVSDSLYAEAKAAQALGLPAQFTKDTELPFSVAGAVKFSNQAKFHPLKFIKALSGGLTVFENTPAERVEENTVITPRGTVRAEKIVFATHFPFVNMPGLYFARMHQKRSYVLALEGAKKMDGMYLGVDGDGLSFRTHGDTLLLGGAGHNCGENAEGGRYDLLEKEAAKYFPNSKIIARWSAQDCMTLDDVPYIGRFSKSRPTWYVATGFMKWGMTSSMAAAGIISELIATGECEGAEVFSPERFSGAALSGLAKNSARSAKGLVRGAVCTPERRCRHLGCRLEWNSDEGTWDCPCHGSRYEQSGKRICGPAQSDLKRD